MEVFKLFIFKVNFILENVTEGVTLMRTIPFDANIKARLSFSGCLFIILLGLTQTTVWDLGWQYMDYRTQRQNTNSDREKPRIQRAFEVPFHIINLPSFTSLVPYFTVTLITPNYMMF